MAEYRVAPAPGGTVRITADDDFTPAEAFAFALKVMDRARQAGLKVEGVEDGYRAERI